MTYAITDLGEIINGYYVVDSTAINHAGQVAGTSGTYSYFAGLDQTPYPGDATAFIYSGGQVTELGTLGGLESVASGMSDAGQVVGTIDPYPASDWGAVAHPFLYSGGQQTLWTSLAQAGRRRAISMIKDKLSASLGSAGN